MHRFGDRCSSAGTLGLAVCRESAAQLTVVDEVVLTAAEDAPEPADQPAKPQNDVDQKLRVAQRTLDAAKSVTPKGSKPPEELTHEVDLLQQIKSAQTQIEAAAERKKELEATRRSTRRPAEGRRQRRDAGKAGVGVSAARSASR